MLEGFTLYVDGSLTLETISNNSMHRLTVYSGSSRISLAIPRHRLVEFVERAHRILAEQVTAKVISLPIGDKPSRKGSRSRASKRETVDA